MNLTKRKAIAFQYAHAVRNGNQNKISKCDYLLSHVQAKIQPELAHKGK